jgi:hypothetical protein
MQYLSLPPFTVYTNFSICLWYYPMVSLQNQPLLYFGNGLYDYNIMMFNSVYQGVPYLNDRLYNRFPNYMAFTSYAGWVLNTWIHTCALVSTTYYSFTVNGYLVGTYDVSMYPSFIYPTITYSTGNNWIGRTLFNSGPYLYQGYVDEIRIYNRTLTPAEAYQVYAFNGDPYTSLMSLQCANGSYGSNFAGSTACGSCVPGTYTDLSQSTCVACPATTYSGISGVTTCSTCPAGTYSTGGQSACTSCQAGTYSTAGTGQSNSSVCVGCVSGSYSTRLGAITSATCLACPGGTFSTATGIASSANCTYCQAGTYTTSPGNGGSTCVSCATGTYSTGLGNMIGLSTPNPGGTSVIQRDIRIFLKTTGFYCSRYQYDVVINIFPPIDAATDRARACYPNDCAWDMTTTSY